jgi:hypothetical protein
MKDSAPLRLNGFITLRKAATLLLTVSLGLTAAASSQVPESVSLWRQWMSVLQREQSQTSGPRLYIQTEREIQQTGPLTAAFQSGSYKFVLADGSTPDTDGDVDGYTDRFEDGNPFANRDDPLAIPLVGNPPLPAPRDTWSLQFFAPTLLANGDFLGLAEPIVTSNTQAILVKPYSGSNVRVSAAPSSRLVRPAPLRDFSTSFNYFIRAPGQPVGVFQEFPISLYYFNKDYPNPTDGKTLEETIVPGVYSVEFPTIRNAPTGKAALQVGHRLVPNGALNVGLKKPSFIVRSLKSTERFNTPPVEQKWVNGRLKFDPYLPMNVSWDDLFKNGLASSGEFIEFSLEDEFGLPISFTFRVTAFTSSLNLNLSSDMYSIYGNIRSLMEQGSLPFSINGNIVLRYLRYANQQPQADLSSVTVRVPVELVVSYASWRNELFPFDSNTDAIAGPGADPDGDGLTNQQEFVAGSDPLVPTIAVADPTSADVTETTATLGATLQSDPLSSVDVTIFERGIIYSASATNPFPTLDGPGVTRVPSSPAEPGVYTVGLTGLSPTTQYSYRGYAISNIGIFYTTPVTTFTTLTPPPLTLPTVISPVSSNPLVTTAVLGGTVTSDGGSPITERGVVFSRTSTNDNPFIGGSGVTKVTSPGTTGVFTVDVTGLTASTTYSFRAYAINSIGTSHTTAIGTFSTTSLPTITSPTSANLTSSSATLGGNITSDGGTAILQRGVVFSSTNNDPVIGGAGVTAFAATTTGTGVFTVNASGLLPGTLYRFKAYAINAVGPVYTAVGTFTTLATVPTVTSPTITNLASTSATLGGNVTSTGQSNILERGFVYSPTAVNSNPVIGGPGVIKVTAAGTTVGAYTANITGLTANTGYTFKAFARNAIGTAYGSPYAFFTTFPPLTVTTPTATGITATNATLGGTVVSDGATTATGRGVVFSQNAATPPVIGGPGVTQITATGTMGPFTVNAASLTPNTTYFFRAYAINNAGTSYSPLASFKTLPLQLLGTAEVQWLAAPQPAAAAPDGEVPPDALQTPPPVPHFVYRKDAAELSESIAYLIETTTDFYIWGPINEAQWQVDESVDTLEATWISQEPPPSSIFFRVKGLAE